MRTLKSRSTTENRKEIRQRRERETERERGRERERERERESFFLRERENHFEHPLWQ